MLSVSFLTGSLCGQSLHSLPVTNPLCVSHFHSLSLPISPSLSHVSLSLCVSFPPLRLTLLCLYFSPVTLSFFFFCSRSSVYLLSHSRARQAQAPAESCWLFLSPLGGRRSGQRHDWSYRIISFVSVMLKSMFRCCVRVGQRIYFSKAQG